MKHIVRATVIALVLTGAVASTHATSTSSSKATVAAAKTSAMPTPMCAPDDPNACGMR